MLQRLLLCPLRACLHGIEALGTASQKFQAHPKQPHRLGGVAVVDRELQDFLYMLQTI